MNSRQNNSCTKTRLTAAWHGLIEDHISRCAADGELKRLLEEIESQRMAEYQLLHQNAPGQTRTVCEELEDSILLDLNELSEEVADGKAGSVYRAEGQSCK